MIKWIYISIFIGVVSACGTVDEDNSIGKTNIDFRSNNLLNPLFFSESGMFNLSFPLWFNQEEVKRFNIDSIYFEANILNWSNDSIVNDEADYSFAFAFTPKGRLKKSTFTDYYELTKLFEATFDYSRSNLDSLGYCIPRIEKTTNLLIGTNPTKLLRTASDLQRFDRLELISRNSEILIFKNTSSLAHEQHIFILNSEDQNILFVDKLETNPEDVFYYGSPLKYSKAFSLTNLVKEDLRSETTFYEAKNYPKTRKKQSNGLITTSTFLYDETGRWLGQRDSLTLNSGQFIKLTESEIVYNEKGLPTSVSLKVGSSKDDLRTSKIVKLSYAFRKKKNG